MKQVNLYVWLVLSALLVLVGMMLISAITSAMAESPVELHICSAKTCDTPDADIQKSLGAGETFYILPSQVTGVSSVHGCPSCSRVTPKTGKPVYVLLPPAVAACVLFGGPACTFEGAK